MPEQVHIRQVLGAPSTSNKLDTEKNRKDLYRYILSRWMQLGRCETLIVCQKKYENYLEDECGFRRNDEGQLVGHGNIYVEHFNNIRGLDQYNNVRLLIVIGGTAPGPLKTEPIAGALFGAQPLKVTRNAIGYTGYPPVDRGIGLTNGSGIKTHGDQHPDPGVEAVRWQINEAEQVHAVGRARGVNRKADNPVDIDMLFDNALPMLVNSVMLWEEVHLSALSASTAVEGVMLTSPCDMVKVWPELWKSQKRRKKAERTSKLKAAQRTVEQGVPELPGFVPVSYQLEGAKMKPRLGYFNLSIIPDPILWLETNIGPVVT